VALPRHTRLSVTSSQQTTKSTSRVAGNHAVAARRDKATKQHAQTNVAGTRAAATHARARAARGSRRHFLTADARRQKRWHAEHCCCAVRWLLTRNFARMVLP